MQIVIWQGFVLCNQKNFRLKDPGAPNCVEIGKLSQEKKKTCIEENDDIFERMERTEKTRSKRSSSLNPMRQIKGIL